MHRQLLTHLLNVADVHLVARLADSNLGFADPNRLYFIFPDMHFIGKARAQLFKYVTNYPDLFTKVCVELRAFRNGCRSQNRDVVVVQLGDCLDLWRQIPEYSTLTTNALESWQAGEQTIRNDNPGIDALYHPDLACSGLLGNHDFDLYHLPEYSALERCLYIPFDPPRAAVLHGDAFSLFERSIPPALKNIIVYIFGPGAKPSDHDLWQVRQEEMKMNTEQSMDQAMDDAKAFQLGEWLPMPTPDDQGVPARYNLMVQGQADSDQLKYLKQAQDFVVEQNRLNKLDLRSVVIGHTHYARIAIDESSGSLFTLMDCGAWIANCRTSPQAPIQPSAQVGVIYNNDMRLYQLSPKHS